MEKQQERMKIKSQGKEDRRKRSELKGGKGKRRNDPKRSLKKKENENGEKKISEV